MFLSEIAPTRIRGALNILFQLNTTVGILCANLINYGTSKYIYLYVLIVSIFINKRTTINYYFSLCACRIDGDAGWRISLGLAVVPALMLTVGSLIVTETPNSLIERGRLDEGKAALRKIRGTENVEPEFADIVEASRLSAEVKHPFRNLLKPKNRPQLVLAILMQVSHKKKKKRNFSNKHNCFIIIIGKFVTNSESPGAVFPTVHGYQCDHVLRSSSVQHVGVRRRCFPLLGGDNRRGERAGDLRVDLLRGQSGTARASSRSRSADDCIAIANRNNIGAETEGPRQRRHHERVGDHRGASDLHIRGGICVVVGTTGMVDPQRGVPSRDSLGRTERGRVQQHGLHFRDCSGFSLHALPLPVRPFCVFLCLDHRHDHLRRLLGARDQEHSHRRDDRESLEETLVLEQVYELNSTSPTEKQIYKDRPNHCKFFYFNFYCPDPLLFYTSCKSSHLYTDFFILYTVRIK